VIHPNLGAEEIHGMTVLTDVGGFNMLLVLAQCRNAVVAAGAVCCYRVMVKGCRAPGVGGVAIVTLIITLNMLRVFPCGGCAIVTA